jgi:hypothetical protein
MDRDKGLAAGQKLYLEPVDRGYKTVVLPPRVMGEYIIHLARATQAVNPQEFNMKKHAVNKYNRLVDRVLSSELVQTILADSSLDK